MYFHDKIHRYSYVTDDIWRPNDAYVPTSNFYTNNLQDVLRPKRPPISAFPNRGEYLKQTIVQDYAKDADKMFLMIKTGATVLWNRLPIHLSTTLTRVPHFGLYADFATSVGGYEVVDTLANLTETTKRDNQFRLYRDLRDMRDRHAISDPGHAKLTGGWDLDKFKNIPMLLHAWNNAPPHVEWFVFQDADTFMMIDNLMDYLNQLNSSLPLYIGEIQYLGGAPFAHGGSGVILSRAAMELSVGSHPEWVNSMEEHTRSVCCGDYMVAYMLKKVNVTILGLFDDKDDEWKPGESFESRWLRNRRRREQEEDPNPREFHYNRVGHKFQKFPHWDLAATREEWCNKIVSFHHLSAMDVELLWEYEQTLSPERRRHITYSDIYRDFVAPHIEYYMPGWNSMARQKEFTESQDLENEIKEIEREWRAKEQEEEKKRKKEEGGGSESIFDPEKLKAVKEMVEKLAKAKKEKKENKENNLRKRSAEPEEENEKRDDGEQEILDVKKENEGNESDTVEEDKKEKEDKKEEPAEKSEESTEDKKSEERSDDGIIDVYSEPDKDNADVSPEFAEKTKQFEEKLAREQEYEEQRKQREEEKAQKIEEVKKKIKEGNGGDTARPWHSAELCQKHCMEDPYCNSWRYLPAERYCANDDAVRLGRPAFTYLTYDEGEKNRKLDGAISGYMIHRIRETRRDKGCDINYQTTEESNALQLIQAANLAKTIDTEEAYNAPNLQPDLYEGWYARRKLHEQFQITKREIAKTGKFDDEKRAKEESNDGEDDEDQSTKPAADSLAAALESIAADNIIPMKDLEDEHRRLRAQQYLQVKNLNELKKVEAALLADRIERENEELEEEHNKEIGKTARRFRKEKLNLP